MNNKISVIIPAYNSGKCIDKTIKSVLEQTYKNFEIIVVDDGSTDNTRQTVSVYTKKFPKTIKYFYQSNKGIAAARNKGIFEASGDYIALLDHDDLWLPEKLKEQVNYLDNNPDVALVHSDCINPDTGHRITPNHLPSGFIFNDLMKENFIISLTVLVRKNIFKEVGLFDEDLNILGSDDADMWIRISHCHKIGYINKILAIRKLGGYSSTHLDEFFNAIIKVRQKNYLRFMKPNLSLRQFRKDYLSPIYFKHGLGYFDSSKYEARKCFLVAFRYNPFFLKSLLNYFFTFLPQSIINFLKLIKKHLSSLSL